MLAGNLRPDRAKEAGCEIECVTFADLVVTAAAARGRDDPDPRPARRHRLRLRNADGRHERRHGAGRADGVPAGLARRCARSPPHWCGRSRPWAAMWRLSCRRRSPTALKAKFAGNDRLIRGAIHDPQSRRSPPRCSAARALVPLQRAIAAGRRRSAEHAAARHHQWPHRHQAAHRSCAEARRAHQAARAREVLRQRAVPPRDRRLHGADRRRHERRRHRRLEISEPAGGVLQRAVHARHRRHGARRRARTRPTASSSSCSPTIRASTANTP